VSGFAGMVFSRGTDKLADKIKQFGFTATVNEAMMCPNIIKEAIQDYRRDPAPIYLIGHSVGGACALSFAESLRDEQIPVRLLVTTEPARIRTTYRRTSSATSTSTNRTACLGYRRRAGARLSRPLCHLRSRSTRFPDEHGEVEVLHDQVLTKMLRPQRWPKPRPRCRFITLCPPARQSNYGTAHAALARPGDTLQTLAAFYRAALVA
jgi:acetyl esterase/lipase